MKKRILLINEDPMMSQFLRDKLGACDFEVEGTGTGFAAIELFKANKADLVLIDPVLFTMDGPSAILGIRAISHATPIFVFSNLPRTMVRACEKAGATKILSAPVNPLPMLIAEIETLFQTNLEGYEMNTQNTDEFWLASCMSASMATLKSMRLAAYSYAKTRSNQSLLYNVFREAHQISQRAASVGLLAIQKITAAIEMLVYDLYEMPEQINDSTVRTAVQSIDFLGTLLETNNLVRLSDPASSAVFAVDDEADALDTIAGAMDMAGLKTSTALNGTDAMGILQDVDFKLIFVDIGLPGISGFDLCKQARTIPRHQKTPIVFLTGMATFQNRALSTLSGGNDFIGKPFNLYELGVKALTWIYKGQLGLV